MARLENVSVEQLQEALESVDDQTATLRIVTGINYKNGVTQTELADWYNVSRTTIHNWLSRLEQLDEEPVDDVVHDDHRSGRPSKLTEEQHGRLKSVLQEPPSELGIDAPAWSPPLVRAFIAEEFNAEYTLRHVRDLMNDAGIVWKTARPDYYESDERAREAFKEGFKKTDSV